MCSLIGKLPGLKLKTQKEGKVNFIDVQRSVGEGAGELGLWIQCQYGHSTAQKSGHG